MVAIGACGGGAPIACKNACVDLGAGELERGLTLDFACGRVVVTRVFRRGYDVVGFKTRSSALHTFYLVDAGDTTTCTDGDEYVASAVLSRVSVCVVGDAAGVCERRVD